MKRVLTFLALMLLPLSVMAMTPVSDSTLSDVTGQAGVNINADLQMNIIMNTVAWGDATGVDQTANGPYYGWTATPAGGYVGLNSLNITNLRIKAREADTYNGYSPATQLKPITIDVATGTGLTNREHGADVTFVRIGLGSLQVTLDALTLEVGLGQRSAVPNLNQLLGSVNLGNIGVYINPGSYIDIYNGNGAAAGGQGVNMFFNVVLDHFQLGYVSWGDADGVVNNGQHGGSIAWMADANAGYVGLANLSIGAPITINGSVRIDVNTTFLGGYSHSSSYGQPAPYDVYAPVSVVHITFGDNFTVTTGAIVADVALGATPNFAPLAAGTTLPSGYTTVRVANPGVLGDIYISTFRLQIDNRSWVDIWAH